MKTKTINEVICVKFDAWIKSIEDEKVRELVKANTVLTGGAIASMLLREPPNDFDFYLRDKETTAAVAHYYVTKFCEARDKRKKEKEEKMTDEEKAEQSSGPDVTIKVEDKNDRIKIVCKSAGIAAEEEPAKVYQYFESQPPEAAAEYVDNLMEIKSEAKKGPLYRPIVLSSNAISLSGDIQIVIRFYGEPDKIHENYDYVHATNYWTSWERKVTLRAEALECLLTKELRYIGSKYPICSVIRARKFIQRQFTINAGQIMKIMFQVRDLDLNNYEVLEDQLTGMDCAYFAEVLSLMKDKDPARVDRAYMIELIDRIFG